MKRLLYYLLIGMVFASIGWFANTFYHLPKTSNSPINQIIPKPLEKYSIENLSHVNFEPKEINIGTVLKDDPNFTSYEFSFGFSPDLSKNNKKITGLINIPKGEEDFPVIVLFRGYVDQTIYKTGDGSRRVGEYLASNGFITIAPDFLGYGGSDKESSNIFESRFQTYVTALNTLASVKNIDKWDGQNIFIWGHSNGGQVALTTLEVSGVNYPTVLWAPVSKPFPYSILYYTDESNDGGKFIRSELAKFEQLYDVDKYSLTNYFDRIKAPVQIHQGTLDDAIPIEWTKALEKNLLSHSIDVEYLEYLGADHNMNPLWSGSIINSLEFIQRHTK